MAVLRVYGRWVVASGFLVVAASLLVAQSTGATEAATAPDDPRIVLMGRVDTTDSAAPRFGYPGTGWAIRFKGAALTLSVDSGSATSALTLVLDGKQLPPAILRQGQNEYEVRVPATVWDSSQVAHTLQVLKRTETWQGVITFRGLKMGASTLLSAPQLPQRRLMFVGDSVTCGTGVNYDATCKNPVTNPSSDAYDSYGMVLGRRLDAQVQLVCYGGRGLERDYRGLSIADGVLNAPQFLDLALAADDAKQRVPWNVASYTPNAIVVSLGTNDFSLEATRPLDGSKFVADYAALLQRLRAEYPQALILGTEGAIVTNPLLRQYIQQAVAKVKDPKVLWIESHHYPGDGCDAHPSREQHMDMADDFEVVLREQLGW